MANLFFTIDVDLSNVQNADKLPKGMEQAFGWSALAVNMPTLTKENLPEFAARLKLYEMVGDGILVEDTEGGTRRNFTSDELRQLIGAECPVVPFKTRKEFLKTLTKELDGKLDSLARRVQNEPDPEVIASILRFAVITTEPTLPPTEPEQKEQDVA